MTKYEIQVTGGLFSVADVVDELLRGEPSVITEDAQAKLVGGSIESDGFGKLLGKLNVWAEDKLSDKVLAELSRQYPGINFALIEVA